MRQVCDLLVWTAQLQLALLGTTLQWPTGTLLSVVGRRMINLGTTGWRRRFVFGFVCCVVLVLFLCSIVSFAAFSHKSCGVFQVSVEGHWTYSGTYFLVLQVSLRLFNLDCRYPRDLLQPVSSKKKSSSLCSSAASMEPLALLWTRFFSIDASRQ